MRLAHKDDLCVFIVLCIIFTSIDVLTTDMYTDAV